MKCTVCGVEIDAFTLTKIKGKYDLRCPSCKTTEPEQAKTRKAASANATSVEELAFTARFVKGWVAIEVMDPEFRGSIFTGKNTQEALANARGNVARRYKGKAHTTVDMEE